MFAIIPPGDETTALKLLEQGADPNSRLELHSKPSSWWETIKEFFGGKKSAVSSQGWTALMAAACYNNPRLVKALLNRGDSVTVREEDGATVLILAVHYISTGYSI